MSIDEIEKEALALPGEVRAKLVDRLVESLESGDFGGIDKLWANEAKRRRDEVRIRTIPGPEGLARVRRSLGR